MIHGLVYDNQMGMHDDNQMGIRHLYLVYQQHNELMLHPKQVTVSNFFKCYLPPADDNLQENNA